MTTVSVARGVTPREVAGCIGLGWEVWSAGGDLASVLVERVDGQLLVTTQELTPGVGGAPRPMTRITLSPEGRCRVWQIASPSVVHYRLDEGQPPTTVPGDGAHAECEVSSGDVLIQATPGLLEALPAGALADGASSYLRWGLEAAARRLIRETSGHPSAGRAAVAMIKRVSVRAG